MAVRADPLPVGSAQITTINAGEPLTVFPYKPPTYEGGPRFVSFHGVGRNAEDYRNFAITLAERFHAIVVAPLFDKECFPSLRYKRGRLLNKDGAAQPTEAWTYAAIPRLVADVRAWEY